MAILQGTVSFPGIDPNAVIGADYTLGHGISPGVCNLRVAAGTGFRADVGDLVFQFGDVKLRFADCALESGALRLGREGHVWNLRLVDRRWKWKYGEITGCYNARGEDGKLDSRVPERSPQQLAKLLLKAMHETKASVSELPDKPRPEVLWDAANPAQELAELCESLGCRVVLGTDGVVRIRRLGRGMPLPDGGLAMNAGLGVERTVPPDELKIVLGATVFQSRLRLEAVGEDVDGSIKPIEKLSYRPKTIGWTHGAAGAKSGLAEKTVFRMYRVKEQMTGGLQFPTTGEPKIKSLDQYVLRETLAETAKGPEGTKHPRPAIVRGAFFDSRPDEKGNTPPNTNYPYGFVIDAKRYLVVFHQPVYKIDKDDQYCPADLNLVTSYHLQPNEVNAPLRGVHSRKLDKRPHSTGARVERHPGIFIVRRALYRGEKSLERVETNRDEVLREAEAYLDALQAEYTEIEQTADVQYAGLVNISPDGAIQQVTWRVGDGAPATTRASRNAEGNIYAPSYAERRRRERAERDRDAAKMVRRSDSSVGFKVIV